MNDLDTDLLKSPWAYKAPPHFQPVRVLATLDSASRLDRVRSCDDPVQLQRYIDWPDTQKTVRAAAQSRLRKLLKKGNQ
jgi:hypothetical protein